MTPYLSQACGAVAAIRSTLLLVLIQRVVVSPHRCFGATYRSHLQGSINMDMSAEHNYIAKGA
jgi:hypothetical protein